MIVYTLDDLARELAARELRMTTFVAEGKWHIALAIFVESDDPGALYISPVGEQLPTSCKNALEAWDQAHP
jgi:hypothetical protein